MTSSIKNTESKIENLRASKMSGCLRKYETLGRRAILQYGWGVEWRAGVTVLRVYLGRGGRTILPSCWLAVADCPSSGFV